MGGESCGFVEAEAGGGSGLGLTRVTLNLLEEAIDHAEMKVKVGVEAGAEAMEKAHGSEGGIGWGSGTGLSQGGLKGPEEDVQHGGGGPGPVVEVGSQTLGEGEHKLSHRDVGEDVVHHMGGGLGHVAGPARRT